MADAHYHFYWQALVDALGYSTEEDLDAATLSDCYVFGKSTGNIRIEGLWGSSPRRIGTSLARDLAANGLLQSITSPRSDHN